MNIYLVRHGQTEWNKKDLLQGQTDVELNDVGKNQAIQTAEVLKNIQFKEIYSSPLKRTLKTAMIIKGNRNLEIIIDNRLIERGYGDYEGLNKISFKKYWDYFDNFSDNNVEPIKNLFERTYSFLEELEKKYNNSDINILIVTHNGANLAISSIINGFIPENIFENNIATCKYKIFENVNLDNWRKWNGKN